MKKGYLPIVLFLVICFNSGCRKIWEYYNGHQQPPEPACQIQQITIGSTFHLPPDWVLTFEYDQWNNPVSVNTSNPDLLNYRFRYDQQHRLTDYIIVNQHNNYVGWHRYGYAGDRIIHDTIHMGAGTNEGSLDSINLPVARLDSFDGVLVSDIYYDPKFRVVADSLRYILRPLFEDPHNPPVLTYNYYYDSTDNLRETVLFLPKAVYDNQVALYRTNKIWQFINRNYSLNNSVAAVSYNSSGLPLAFRPPPQTPYIPQFLGFSLGDAKIEYACGQ